MNSPIDCLTFDRHVKFVRKQTNDTQLTPYDEPEVTTRSAGPLLATDIKVTGEPLDPTHMGRIIKPRELVDIIELTPLNRSETILYNQLLAHAWNNIRTTPVHKV